MLKAFTVSYLGNVSSRRTEAEVSSTASSPGEDPLCAVLYDSSAGVVTELFGAACAQPEMPGLKDALADARAGLMAYVNRRGENAPAGLTRAGFSLWLLEKSDGTAGGASISTG